MTTLFKSVGFSNCSSKNLKICDVYFHAKQSRTKFRVSENKAKNLFELVHCDIEGPYRVSSLCGAHYFLTIIDDVSRVVWLYLMKEKSKAGYFFESVYFHGENSI